MTAPLLLLAVGATLAQPAGACPAAHVTVEVVARLDTVQTGRFVGLREIEDLRDRYGRPCGTVTLGFYAVGLLLHGADGRATGTRLDCTGPQGGGRVGARGPSRSDGALRRRSCPACRTW